MAINFHDLNNIADAKTLRAEIKKFGTEGQTRQEKAHYFAVAALWHANEHGDTSLLTMLHENFSDREQADKRMFRAWVGIFTTQGMSIDETEDGYRPAVAFKPRITWYEATEDTPKSEFRKTASLSKGDSLPGSFSDGVELAKAHPYWEFAAFRSLRPEAAFNPNNAIRNMLRSMIRNKIQAEQSGYTLLADQLQKAIDSLGKGHWDEDTKSAKVDEINVALVRKASEIENQPQTH